MESSTRNNGAETPTDVAVLVSTLPAGETVAVPHRNGTKSRRTVPHSPVQTGTETGIRHEDEKHQVPPESPAPGEPGPAAEAPTRPAETGTGSDKRESRLPKLSLFGVLAGVAVLAAVLGTVGVATAGFALSYDAMTSVAAAAHIRPALTPLLPVTVDGVMVVATVTAVVMQYKRHTAALYPWAVVIISAAISIGCNGLHATGTGQQLQLDTPWRVAVSSIPALNLALSVHLLIELVQCLVGNGKSTGKSRTAKNGTGQPGPKSRPASPGKSRTDGTTRPQQRNTGPTETTEPGGTNEADQSRAEAGSKNEKRDRARELWEREVAGGRIPKGSELATVAGVDPSLGRRWRREWLPEVKTDGSKK